MPYPYRLKHHRILTAKEERAISRRIREGTKKRKGKDGRVSFEYTGDALDAIWELVRFNTRLVVNVVSRRRPTGMNLDDAIGWGILGLVRAASTFNPRHGKFSTYAVWWIRQHVYREGMNESRLVRVPVAKLEKGYKGPSTVTIIDRNDLEDREHAPKDFDQVDTQDEVEALGRAMLDVLTPRQRLVLLRRRYRGHTLSEIAKDVGLSRERVRQIEREAVQLLREFYEKREQEEVS